ncbi:MAG: cytochrome c-type biogenesis protein [Geminicoccaceae bacterium]
MIKALVLALLVLASPAWAATSPSEMLPNPALEARARTLGKELRCLVCQNQSIDDSDADLAKDLRHLVRERLIAGDSDQEVLAFVTQRYGDFVLLKPPVKPATWLLWFGPPVVLVIGGGLLLVYFRGRRRDAEAAPELEPAERERLSRLLAGDGGR